MLRSVVVRGLWPIALVLTACGGSADRESDTTASQMSQVTPMHGAMDRWASTAQPPQRALALSETQALQWHLTQSAELNRATLAAAAQSALQRPASAAGANFTNLVPVYRLFNTQTAAHFYTSDPLELQSILANLPQFQFDGPAFTVSSTAQPGLSPVHRFFNTLTGIHFYTISEAERSHIQTNLPQFLYEGIAYHASQTPGVGRVPLYRFFRADRNLHFFTNNVPERDQVNDQLCDYRYEGIGFFALDPNAPGTVAPEPPQNPVVLVAGDSLSQGYGYDVDGDYFSFVTPGLVWPEQLHTRLKNHTGRACARVVNVSVGGFRTDHGSSRMAGWLGAHNPTHVILAQGTNDAWQGYGWDFIQTHLNASAQQVRQGSRKLFVMELAFLPFGPAYQQGLSQIYQQVAIQHQGYFIPGTQGLPLTGTYYYSDQVHQRDAAQAVILDNVWGVLAPRL